MTIEARDLLIVGLDAVIADNTLNRQGFVDAMQTAITSGLRNQEGNDWVDAISVEYSTLELCSNPTYVSWRNQALLNPTRAAVIAMFDALNRTITGVPAFVPVGQAIDLFNLRENRDNIDTALDRFDVLIAAEPNGAVGRLVKEQMRESKQRLRELKQNVRAAIQAITGDPDS